jgi:hypothetical protein
VDTFSVSEILAATGFTILTAVVSRRSTKSFAGRCPSVVQPKRFFMFTTKPIGDTSVHRSMKTVKLTTALLFVSLRLTSASAMEMHVEGDKLIVTGPLSGFELTQFGSALTPSVTTVVFYNSRGGDYSAGVNLAHEIRRRNLTTVALGYCDSSCANAFLGGIERRLANAKSFVAFHGSYDSYSRTTLAHIGEMRRFYDEMTGGKVSDDLVQMWLRKPRAGMIYFYKHQTYSCNGDEPKRPSGCEKLPQRAIDQGVITSLDDVEANLR